MSRLASRLGKLEDEQAGRYPVWQMFTVTVPIGGDGEAAMRLAGYERGASVHVKIEERSWCRVPIVDRHAPVEVTPRLLAWLGTLGD